MEGKKKARLTERERARDDCVKGMPFMVLLIRGIAIRTCIPARAFTSTAR